MSKSFRRVLGVGVFSLNGKDQTFFSRDETGNGIVPFRFINNC
jgi:hypothetical protein